MTLREVQFPIIDSRTVHFQDFVHDSPYFHILFQIIDKSSLNLRYSFLSIVYTFLRPKSKRVNIFTSLQSKSIYCHLLFRSHYKDNNRVYSPTFRLLENLTFEYVSGVIFDQGGSVIFGTTFILSVQLSITFTHTLYGTNPQYLENQSLN